MDCDSNPQANQLSSLPDNVHLQETKMMNRAISTILTAIVLSTLIATSAIAADQKADDAQPNNLTPDQIYVQKYGS